MPRARDQLVAVEWAVLAQIDEQPTHGFAIARAMLPDGEVGRVWSARRPLVYRAIDGLTDRELVRPAASTPGESGPQRTILAVTASGHDALATWLVAPVEHLRDARSLLMLKLLFLQRRQQDPRPLLDEQHERFALLEDRLVSALDGATGFDRSLARWRLESVRAANRFLEAAIAER